MKNNHDTHYCCNEVMERDGDEAIGCCCTGHKCKDEATMRKSRTVGWETRFDEQFEVRNDCSNRPRKHHKDCQGCIEIIVEEPEVVKNFIAQEIKRAFEAGVRRQTT